MRQDSRKPPGEGIFTAFLHSLMEEGRPEDGLVRDVLKALERLLRQELRRRGLWKLPPVRLGIIGFGSWADPGAIAELAADAFEAALLKRLRGLLSQLHIKLDVDGIVRLNVSRFVRDLQRQGDPVGYRAWEVVQRAAERAVARGTISILEYGPPIGGATRLATRGAVDRGGREEGGGTLADLDGLKKDDHRWDLFRARIAGWNQDLLPDIVVAGGRHLDDVVARFSTRLPELSEDGIGIFRLTHLVTALREDLRPQWASRIWSGVALVEAHEIGLAGAGEADVPVLQFSQREVSPEVAFSRKESARHLHRCVARALNIEPPRIASEAGAIWRFISQMAYEEDTLPSHRQIARALGIPRSRVPELLGLIRRVVGGCLQEIEEPLREKVRSSD